MKNKIIKIFQLLQEIRKLPKAEIYFKNYANNSKKKYIETYKYFTKLHRLKLFKNKTLGVALIDLKKFANFEEYYKSVNGKNSAAYYSRKALKRGYKFVEIDRNNFIDDIFNINTSVQMRQGKNMASSYLVKVDSYMNESNYKYFGVVDSDGKLVSYCNIGFYGEFSLIVTLLGHHKHLNDGIMYLMMIKFNEIMFNEYKDKGYQYIMYDTFFGASQGLKMFKNKLGYKPYKVEWKWKK